MTAKVHFWPFRGPHFRILSIKNYKFLKNLLINIQSNFKMNFNFAIIAMLTSLNFLMQLVMFSQCQCRTFFSSTVFQVLLDLKICKKMTFFHLNFLRKRCISETLLTNLLDLLSPGLHNMSLFFYLFSNFLES